MIPKEQPSALFLTLNNTDAFHQTSTPPLHRPTKYPTPFLRPHTPSRLYKHSPHKNESVEEQERMRATSAFQSRQYIPPSNLHSKSQEMPHFTNQNATKQHSFIRTQYLQSKAPTISTTKLFIPHRPDRHESIVFSRKIFFVHATISKAKAISGRKGDRQTIGQWGGLQFHCHCHCGIVRMEVR